MNYPLMQKLGVSPHACEGPPPLRASLRTPAPLLAALLAVAASLSAQTTSGTAPSRPSSEAETVKLDKYVVTGSLLPAAAGATASPVSVLSIAEIEKVGVNNDVLQLHKKAEPYFYGANNLGSDNGNIQSGSTNGGSTVALRNRSTLVLINGRRVNVHPLAGQGSSFFDVSMIPISAIDRVEVLSDGASATYGSDAVSGVVNIILKSNFQGGEIGGRFGFSPNDGDYSERSYYGTFGASNEKTSVTLSTEWKKSDPLIQYQRPFGVGQFRTPSYAGVINIGTDFYYMNPSTNAPPRNLDLTPAQAVAQGLYRGPLTQSEASQFFDLAQYPTMLLEAERRSLVGAIEHVFNDKIRGFADVLYSVNDSESVLNAQPVSGNVAADNPNNPFNVTVTARNRFVTFPRVYGTETTALRGVIGLKGQIGDSSWTYEIAGNFNRAVSRFINRGLIDSTSYTNAVNSGAYNPFARTQAPGVIESFSGVNYRNYTSELNSFDLRVTGELMSLESGPVALGIGASATWESLKFENERNDRLGLWLQATPAQPFSARSNVDGFSAELRVPIFGEGRTAPFAHLLEASIAARKDIYSQTSDPFVPKVSLRWLPFNDELAFRGTYSESFSAPTLFDLRGPTNAGFTSSINITRFNASGTSLGTTTGSRQYRSRGGSNANLNPSESRNWTVGVVWSPKKIQGFEISADWFSIDERDLIASIPSDVLVQDVERLGTASPFASKVRLGTSLAGEVYFDTGTAITAPGQMSGRPSDEVWITNPITNIAGNWQQGMDVRSSYTYDAGGLGTFRATLTGVYLHEYVRQELPILAARNFVDAYSDLSPKGVFPRYRTYSTLGWSKGGMTAGIAHTFIPEVDDVNWPTPFRVDSYHAFDLNFGYNLSSSGVSWLRGTSFMVGINNAFNKYPPLIRTEGNQSHDINTYDAIGRFFWVSARVKF
jgi:iron complex outermembrane recepter protein